MRLLYRVKRLGFYMFSVHTVIVLIMTGTSNSPSRQVGQVDQVASDHFIYLPIVSNGLPPQIESSSVLISASTGGTVKIGEATLTIPSGALTRDTNITVGRIRNAPDIGDAGVSSFLLEPSGLALQQPATLTIKYLQPLVFSEEWLSSYTFNKAKLEWEPLNILGQNKTTNELNVEVKHFSYVTTIFEQPLNVVFNLPGKYLKKGDLLLTLTHIELFPTTGNERGWFPGHAGLYLGVNQPNLATNDGQTIIESTPGWVNPGTTTACRDGGVRSSNLSGTVDSFVTGSGHLYMGARRLAGMSERDRNTIATYALSKLNRGYALVGSGNIGDTCFSCVGLTEGAYDAANRSIIPAVLEFPFILPIEQFIRTQPVDEFTVQAGERVQFEYYRVFVDPVETQAFSISAYGKDQNVSITGCPSGAACSNGVVDWQTTSSTIGDFELNFSTSKTISGQDYIANQKLTIHVVSSGQGSVTGRIVDSTTGYVLSGSTITLGDNQFTAISNNNGDYTFANIPAGNYTISAGRSGYVQINDQVTVSANSITRKNLSLPPAGTNTDIIVTLNWGEVPRDLDSHLWLPSANPFHIYFGNKGRLDTFPLARLDVDDTSSYGPENVTIRQLYPGRYIYAVYNYSGSPDIKSSNAQISVVMNGQVVRTYIMPGTGNGRWWYVFDYDVATNSIVDRNYITSVSPGTTSLGSEMEIK